MPQVRANGINIEYDCFGTSGDPTVLDDPLLPALAGFDTIMPVRSAKAEFIDDMAHDLPEPLRSRIADSIVTHCSAANGQERKVE